MFKAYERLRMGRFTSVLLMVILVVNFFAVQITAVDADNADAKFTDLTLTVDGDVINTDNDVPLEQDGSASLTYDFQVINSGNIVIDTNDTVSTTIPDGFLIANEVTGDIVGTRAGDIQEIIGSFTLALDRSLTIKFNANVHNSPAWNGQVVLTTEFRLSELPGDDNPAEFTFAINDTLSKTLNLKFAPGGSASAVKKTGTPYNGGVAVTENPDRIKWSIEVNSNLESINAVVEDTIPAGLELTGNAGNNYNVVVYERDVDLNGNISGTDVYNSANYTVAYDDGSRLLSVDLGDITSAYRIEFDTTIEEANWNQLSFDNTSVLVGLASSEATVAFTRGEKIGKSAASDRAFNPTEIDWVIDVNMYGHTLTAGTVEDTIPAGLTLDGGSLVYSTLTLDADGEVSAVTPGAAITLNQAGNDLEFVLPADTSDAYRIAFTTSIDSTADATYDNTATLKDGGVDVAGGSDSASIDANYGDLITKSGQSSIGYGSANHKINWTIDLNTVQSAITGGVLTDVIPAGLTLENIADIDLNKLTIADNGDKTVGAGFADRTALTYDGGSRTLTLDLDKLRDDNGDANLGYGIRIAYTTTIDDEDDRGPFTNNATLKGTSTAGSGGPIGGDLATGITKTATPGVSFDNNIVKNLQSIDYENKIMYWRIRVRPYKEPMQNLVITDTFPNDGLEYVVGSFAITDNLDVTIGNVASDNDSSGGIDYADGFIMTFNENVPDDKQYTITYQTYFDRLTHDDGTTLNQYKNRADAQWDENGDPDTNSDLNNTVTATVNDSARDNGNKSGSAVDRASKTIDWEINANYLSESYVGYTISDTIPDDDGGNAHYHQEFDGSSLKVYRYSIDASGNMSGDGAEIVEGGADGEYTVVNSTATGFEIRINGVVDYPVRVKYKTKLINESVGTYSNTATLNADRSVSASVSHNNHDAFASKSYVYTSNEAKIDWTVEINESLSTIDNGIMVDTLSAGHEFDEDSLKVYKQPGDVLVDPDADPSVYSAVIETIDVATGQQRLTLTFEQVIEDQYTVEYTTHVFVSSNQTISNNVSFSGDGIIAYDDTDDEEQAISVTAGYAAALAARQAAEPKGDLTVTKVDGDDNAVKLAGAVYELYDDGDNLLMTLAATDGAGEATVSRLDYGDYYLKEITSPAGYQTPNPNRIDVTIDEETEAAIVENYLTRSLKITKVAESDNTVKLQNAVFDVKGPIGLDSEATVRITTDENGEATAANLAFGNYTVTEVSAPSGYVRDSSPVNVTIDNSSMLFELTVENERRTSSGGTVIVLPEPEPEPEEEPEEEILDQPKKEEEVTEEDKPVGGTTELPEGGSTEPGKKPENGTVEVDDKGNWLYTPDPGFKGKDQFSIIVVDPDGEEEEILIDIFVEEIPEGIVELPETGGVPMAFYAGLSSVMIGAGVKLRRRKRI